MKDLSEINLPGDLQYTDEHIWVRKDDKGWTAGVSDFAQDQLGEVVFVDLPASGNKFAAGSEFGGVESLKSVNPLYMPVSGTITEINPALDNLPSLVNADCYGQAWMIRFTPDSDASVESLLSAAAYRDILKG